MHMLPKTNLYNAVHSESFKPRTKKAKMLSVPSQVNSPKFTLNIAQGHEIRYIP